MPVVLLTLSSTSIDRVEGTDSGSVTEVNSDDRDTERMRATGSGWSTREKKDRLDSATRSQLLDAAKKVLEARGYARTTIADIAEEAGVSRATFYVYFASKAAVFAVLAENVRDAFLGAQELHGIDPDDPYAVAEATNAAYLDVYAENLSFMTVLRHQSLSDVEIRTLWNDIRSGPARRSARYIERLAKQGIAEPAAPPAVIAQASGAIVADLAAELVENPSRRAALVTHLTSMFLRLVGVTQPREA
jgi:AcrR family transcriptional regulator